MSTQTYDNRNSGTLWRNDRKLKETHADFTGSWTDSNGQEFYLSAWVNESKRDGKKFFSIKLGNPKDQHNAPSAPPPPMEIADSEDIPF